MVDIDIRHGGHGHGGHGHDGHGHCGQLQWSIIGSDMPSALGLVENDMRTLTAPFIAI